MIKSISSLLFYSNDLDKTFEFYKSLVFEVEKDEKTGVVSFYVNWFSVNFIDREHSTFKSGFDGELGRGMFTYVNIPRPSSPSNPDLKVECSRSIKFTENQLT